MQCGLQPYFIFLPKSKILHQKYLKNTHKIANMHLLELNLENFTPDIIFYTDIVRGVCDKYEVWRRCIFWIDYFHSVLNVHHTLSGIIRWVKSRCTGSIFIRYCLHFGIAICAYPHHVRQYMHLLIQSRVFICIYMHLCVPDIHINLHSPIHVWYPLVWIACASSTPGQTERAYGRRVRNEGLCKCISVYWRKIDVDVRLGRAVVLWLREWLLHSDVNPGSPDCEYLSSLWPHSPT